MEKKSDLSLSSISLIYLISLSLSSILFSQKNLISLSLSSISFSLSRVLTVAIRARKLVAVAPGLGHTRVDGFSQQTRAI